MLFVLLIDFQVSTFILSSLKEIENFQNGTHNYDHRFIKPGAFHRFSVVRNSLINMGLRRIKGI